MQVGLLYFKINNKNRILENRSISKIDNHYKNNMNMNNNKLNMENNMKIHKIHKIHKIYKNNKNMIIMLK
jgi:hypothetical protein